MRGQWPLVGRATERDEITAMLGDPAAAGVVIAGPAGAGKTRRANECVATSERTVVRVAATRAAASIPLGAFAPYLPPTGPADGADSSRLRLAADAIVSQGSAKESAVVFVDDAHALDDASAALLHHLAIGRRAFLLVTIRAGEQIPDAVRELWKDLLPRLDLAPLDLHDVVELLENELGGSVDGATSFAIHHASQGNALYLRELLDGMLESGALENAGGMWTLRGPITAAPRLIELVTDRLEGLTGRERFVLQTLALTEPMGLPIIEGLGWAEEWGSLEKKGLAEVRRSSRRQQLFISHPLHAEVLRATITTRRRNAILRESAASVRLFNFRRRDDARRVAVWELEAGERADAEVVLAAARDAQAGNDHETAARLAQAALDADGGSDAALVLGLSLDSLGRHFGADVALARAEAEAETEQEIAVAAITRSGHTFRGLARPDDAHKIATAAEERVSDPILRAGLEGQRSYFSLFEGDVPTTYALTDPLLAHDDTATYCIAALPAAMIRLLNGRIQDAIEVSTRAFETRVQLGPEYAYWLGDAGVYLVAQALALLESGRLQDGINTAQFSYDVAAGEQHRLGMAWLAIALGRAHMLTGRLATASRFGREGALLFGELNHAGARWGYGLVALAQSQLGVPDAAEEALADLDAEPDTTVRLMDSDIERARAWASAARGDLPRARAEMLAAADIAADRELFMHEAALLHDIARLGGADQVAERLAQRALRVDGALMEARVAFVSARAADDAEALEAASIGFETLGALLYAAEAANEAAIAYRHDGLTRPAAAVTQLAQQLAAQCEGARTPSLMHGTGTAVLTKREREVATLASHGLSSREIASTLYVSIRTVDNHLQHAYEKLGVSSRSDLADALTRAGY
jgi:DNA-binding CsgD family transcriptional regulator